MSLNDFRQKEASVGFRLSDFEIVKQLGKGSYGTVYVVTSKLDKNTYVMKKMELNHLKESQQKECYREVSILRKVSHPNIIRYYSSFLENESLCIIMEYAELGDLYTLIKHYKRHKKFFDENILWRIAFEVLNGLEYLHTNNIIHRDIKCLNLFLSKDHHVKIGDLGVSTIASLGGMHRTRVGTPLYLSPELIKQIPYDFKTDIWSFGCSLSKKPEKRPSAKDAKSMIPANIMENIFGNKNKEEIKIRPFSSLGKRKNKDFNVNDKTNSNNILNNKLEKDNATTSINLINKVNSNTNNYNNFNINLKQNNEKIKINENINKVNDNKNNNKEEKECKENINNRDNNYNNKKKVEIKENIIILSDKDNLKIDDKNEKENKNDNDINEKNLKRQNSNLDLDIKRSSLFNLMNGKKNFNCFRNNSIHKKTKEQKTYRNIFNINNKIIKNNSIKVYSSMIQKEFSDKTKKDKEKELMKQKEVKSNNVNKKEKKENAVTDANIQLISINNNNIIINQINNNNFFPSTIPNKISSQPKILKNIKTNKENKKTEKETILFPDLKLKKTSSVKDKAENKEIDNKIIKNKTNNENYIFSQKLVHPKSQRPLSSVVFRQKANKNINNGLDNSNNNLKRVNNGRPLTGFKPNFNNNSNVMNININFFNIDMNRRFLAPDINPLHSNEFENIKEKGEVIKRGDSKVSINLKDYQNDNEFIFSKLIKALQDINSDKKLTINDLH